MSGLYNADLMKRVHLAAADKAEKKLVKLSFAEDFVLSGVAAVTSKTIAAPIERIKMVVQNQDEMLRRGTLEKPFTGIADCGRWIVANEGVAAFWKSNFTNCLRYFPTQALNFGFKGQIKKMDAFKKKKDDPYALTMTKNIVSGGLAGGGSLTFVYSLDYARTRLANDLKSTKGGGEREFNGLIDVYKKTLKSDGIQGLYRGFNISFVGIFVYRGFYFGLYDSILPLFPPEQTGLALRFAVGYFVTVLAGLASYPIDTIRRRMMMTSGDATLQYKNSMECAKVIMSNEGFKSFFKGAGANILRGIAGAGVLAGFDTVTDAYVKYAYGENASVKR
jgi:solute carrier family 25 (adenine nucleotide translocator) protein 4/5/6/31